jgi:hypothetical protein
MKAQKSPSRVTTKELGQNRLRNFGLDALLKAYKAPEDIVGAALAGLKAKYKLTPKDL